MHYRLLNVFRCIVVETDLTLTFILLRLCFLTVLFARASEATPARCFTNFVLLLLLFIIISICTLWSFCRTADQDDSNSGSEKKKKRRSRWGDSETEKNVVAGLPVVVPQGLTKEQEEQYLRAFVCFMALFILWFSASTGKWRGAAVNIIGLVNKVNPHWAWLVHGWVTVFRQVNHFHIEQANYVNSAFHLSGSLNEDQLLLGSKHSMH